jgi:hypothetical protein
LPAKTKHEAFTELTEAQEALDLIVKELQKAVTGDQYEALAASRKRLNKAKREARNHWMPGDPPIF